jgi:hypothetical protein
MKTKSKIQSIQNEIINEGIEDKISTKLEELYRLILT